MYEHWITPEGREDSSRPRVRTRRLRPPDKVWIGNNRSVTYLLCHIQRGPTPDKDVACLMLIDDPEEKLQRVLLSDLVLAREF